MSVLDRLLPLRPFGLRESSPPGPRMGPLWTASAGGGETLERGIAVLTACGRTARDFQDAMAALERAVNTSTNALENLLELVREAEERQR